MGEMHDEIHSYAEQVEPILAQKRAATGIDSIKRILPESQASKRAELKGKCSVCGERCVPIARLRGMCAECADIAGLGARIIEERLRRAGLCSGPTGEMSFATFQHRERRHELAYGVVSSWLDGYPYSDGASVLLWSKGFGAGKTHLARAVQRCIIEGGGIALFRLMADVLAAIRDTYDAAGGLTELAITGKMASCELLIWDDLGKEYVSSRGMGWFHNIVFRVVDERYRHGRAMLVTSNVEPKVIAQVIGGAAASRLMEMIGTRICDMSGPDWRMRT